MSHCLSLNTNILFFYSAQQKNYEKDSDPGAFDETADIKDIRTCGTSPYLVFSLRGKAIPVTHDKACSYKEVAAPCVSGNEPKRHQSKQQWACCMRNFKQELNTQKYPESLNS